MGPLVGPLLALVLLLIAYQTIIGSRPRFWRGPDFLNQSDKQAERQRRRSSAIVEAAVLLGLYPLLVARVGLPPKLAIIVLGTFCIGLFFRPNITRTATGILAGILAIITMSWHSIEYGATALLMITSYVILAAVFAPMR